MHKSFLSRAALIVLSSALAALAVACSEDKQTTETVGNQQSVVTDNLSVQPSVESAAPVASPEPEALPPSELEPSYFELGLDKAAGAVSISQSAQSVQDWNLVANQFQEAIALMEQVSSQSPDFVSAQGKIVEYQRKVKYALQKANPNLQPPSADNQKIVVAIPQPKTTPRFTPPPIPTTQPPEQRTFSSAEILPPEKNVFIAPIKRRSGGTPIVEVTFNGQQKFDMIVDTGASGTVITQQMANDLGIIPVGKAKANTASSKAVEFPVGYVDSMAVSGVKISRVPVAIAGTELETGLLGHDFFGNYDVTIKRNVIEFRPQSHSEVNSVEIELAAPTFPKNSRSLESP
ncbi:retroviral-like aspartic protease family protein [Nostoc sp. FACHB-152]|uniref:retroviral-like aspartic protease family protein n=1 Tax=unclassified Nostoc TaxID=2593658 RepID=UPI001683D114|nr:MULTISPECIES: retroviral-like aspartic protease family protein [unclassified Nostoc]MBD2450788.1 retroviral-like aspartic protease family protein [Nostoc sp. FACHB-152]MBD2470239.1 retroviral-like aspartic protease family protein [Nostoc sp. FACHB-145]